MACLLVEFKFKYMSADFQEHDENSTAHEELTRVGLAANVLKLLLLSFMVCWLWSVVVQTLSSSSMSSLEFLWNLVWPADAQRGRLCGYLRMDWVRNGDWWRFWTYGFMHHGILHLIFNMLAIRTFGRELIDGVGISTFVLILVLCLSNVLGAAFALELVQAVAGASAMAYGLIFANLICLLSPSRAEQKKAACLFVAMVLENISAIWLPVSWLAHLGGACAGAILGLGILQKEKVLSSLALVASLAVLMISVTLNGWRNLLIWRLGVAAFVVLYVAFDLALTWHGFQSAASHNAAATISTEA